MKRIALALASMLMVFLFAACTPAVTSGTVTGKSYHAAHDTTAMIPIYTTSCTSQYNPSTKSSSQNCTQQFAYFMPVTTHHSECYELNLKNDDGNTGSVCASQTDYETIKVGDFWGTR